MDIRTTLLALSLLLTLPVGSKVKTNVKSNTPQAAYAASRLETIRGDLTVTIEIANAGDPEGFTITHSGQNVTITGNDGPGCIYGANRLIEEWQADPSLAALPPVVTDAPQMVMRGACVGLQKTEYLPGHRVYEYPYTPENFPWFYDKALWLRYLDMLASCNMNTVYLWNGHPFASLVKLDDYPFAPEVDDATMQLNQEMFGFLVDEADRRGIRVIQMFYNIIVSKPFADHYGLKTQDRNRPITPLIADYTRKSIAAFVEKYPKVGLLICLGEAMSGITTDIAWMTQTIIPGILDGLAVRSVATQSQQTGQASLPPIILRSHDTFAPAVLKAALPLYPNIYTMSKYTGESLTTYEPGGPWGETHRELAAAAPVHIDNVHILANLEPWRWSSPAFIRKTVDAMHRVHHSKGLHLYPQASYWDWPYTADCIAGEASKLCNSEDTSKAWTLHPQRLLQIDRDWMWYKAWGRYAWSVGAAGTTETTEITAIIESAEKTYWMRQLAQHYAITEEAAACLLEAYDEAGEIAPKLLRRFGITEGNRQTLLLGMTMAQLVNPYKFNIYHGFYESCGPEGEKLIEYVEKEHKHQAHKGELPLDIVAQCVEHGRRASEAFDRAVQYVATESQQAAQKAELLRFGNDVTCYAIFALHFQQKVLAAKEVLDYKWTKNIKHLEKAVPLLENSLALWRVLAQLTDSTYLYANSMQTAQRRIPVGGDNGKMKTWRELLPVYEAELAALKTNIEKLKHPVAPTSAVLTPLKPAAVQYVALPTQQTAPATVTLQKGAILFENRPDTPVDSVAPELAGLKALVLNRDSTRIVGTTIGFETDKPVKVLVGFFKDDDPKWATPPKLETDATGNEYGQAEPVLTNAIAIEQMPKVNIHAYNLPAGRHTLRLPKGIIMVAGITNDDIRPRDCALNGPSTEVDWLFAE